MPSGVPLASVLAYTVFSLKQGPLISPDGRRSVTVVIHDGGATHSGNHRAWIVGRSALFGKHVVGTGYLEDSWTPVTLRWIDDTTIELEVLTEKYEGEKARVVAVVE